MTEEKKAVVELPAEVDKVVSELAKATGKSKDEIVSELLKKSIEYLEKLGEEDEDEDIKFIKKLESDLNMRSPTFQDIKEIFALKALGGDTSEKELLKMMKTQFYWTMYLQTMLMNRKLMKELIKEEGEDRITKLLKALIKEIKRTKDKEEKERLYEVLEKLVKREEEREKERVYKELEEMKKILQEKEKQEQEKRFEEIRKQIDNLMYYIDTRLAQLEQQRVTAAGDELTSLENAINKLKRAKNLLKSIKDVVEEKPLVTQQGINWERVLTEIKDIVTSVVAPKPQPQPVQYYYPPEQQSSPLSNVQVNVEELQKDREALKPVTETSTSPPPTTEVQQNVESTEVKTEEKTEAQPSSQENFSNQVATESADDNISLADLGYRGAESVLTIGDIKRYLGRNDVYIKDGQIWVGNRVLSENELERLASKKIDEMISRGELKVEIESEEKFQEILNDPEKLQAIGMYAQAGIPIIVGGKDRTQEVLEALKKLQQQ